MRLIEKILLLPESFIRHHNSAPLLFKFKMADLQNNS